MVPPGFAHGNFFPAASRIEYFCTGEYSPACEAGISPFAEDIDWRLCDPRLKARFDDMSGRDHQRQGSRAQTLGEWADKQESAVFRYADLLEAGFCDHGRSQP